jgi:hypothetical protein
MRIVIVFFPLSQKRILQNLAKSLSSGIESQGHHADIIDGSVDRGKKLTIYQYIVLMTESAGFSGRVPEIISQFLKDAGNLIGKWSSAFVLKAVFGSDKTLLKLMKAMESEGMYLKFSDVLKNDEEALLTGKRLHFEGK